MGLFSPKSRTHEARPEEMTASVTLDLSAGWDARYLRNIAGAARIAGVEPWKWYKEIGEVHYAVGRGARVGGYARIQARELKPDGTLGKILGGLPGEIADTIWSPYGGSRGLVERFITTQKIPGDSYLIECRENPDGTGDFDGYDWLSASEIDLGDMDAKLKADSKGDVVFSPTQRINRITHPRLGDGSSLMRQVEAQHFLGRVWRPSAQYVDMADSPMRALETECRLLHLMTMSLEAKMMSRLALNGILYVPSEVNLVSVGANKNGTKGTTANTVIQTIRMAAEAQIMNRDMAPGSIPIMMSGPGQWAEAVRHIVLDQEVYKTDMDLRNELIKRILTGLDVQPQQVRGDGSSNHWNSWSEANDEMRVNIQPDLETMCWAMTRIILHRKMREANHPEGRIRKTILWYDLTDANVQTNAAEDVRQVHDRGAVNDEYLRKVSNIDEDSKPTETEQIRWFGRKHGDPYLATYMMDMAEKIDWEKVGAGGPQPGPTEESPADESKTGPGKSSGGPGDSKSDTPKRLKPAS